MFRGTFVGTVRASRTDKILSLGLLAALAAVLMLLLAAQPALAVNTLVVNRTGDESEPIADRGNGVCDAISATAGNQCSLRAAIQEANVLANVGGPDEIKFNIPGDTKKVKTIKPASELPALTQAVTIDGYTQPGSKKNTRLTGAINAVPKVQLDGSEANIDADGLIIQGASDITIRGLVINRFDRSGIFLTSTDGSDNNHIEGNFIGTNAAGTAALGNGSAGVEINGLNDGNVVGGNLAEQRNLISGNEGDGVFAGTDGTDTIQGNLIGTDKIGTKDLHNGGTNNNGEGVNLGGQNSVVKDNIIAFNTSDGVQVRSNATGVGHNIGPNSIFSNDGLGIDIVDNANSALGPNGNGPNTNDGGTANDGDTGPNNLQNFPEITSATTSSSTGETKIDMFLDTVPISAFDIRFYSNPRDTGEGKTFIGQLEGVTTNSNGTASINDFVATKSVLVGQSITATATDPSGSTSEFTGEPRSVRAAP
jgi:CSLREA domain-containing protein